MVKKKDLICFDLDGTLVDSTKAHIKSYKTAITKNNLTYPGDKKLLSLFGLGSVEIFQKLFPKVTPRKINKLVEDHLDAHEKSKDLIKILPGVEEALVRLKMHFRLGIVSNNYYEGIMEILEYAGIPTKIFDVIIGADDAKPKPSPAEIFLAEKLTKADAKIMVGDTTFDMKAGKKAGCRTVGVLTGLHTMEQLMNGKADMLVSSVRILPDLLLNK
jgi:HAD superfamily hydrolase (TIGR01549 family)